MVKCGEIKSSLLAQFNIQRTVLSSKVGYTRGLASAKGNIVRGWLRTLLDGFQRENREMRGNDECDHILSRTFGYWL